MRRATLVLLAIVALSAATLTSLGLRQFVGYDSIWHVFIARQETWPLLWQEIFVNAHPPLFYLALRAALGLFGDGLLSYRVVSILSVLVSIPLVVLVARRITRNEGLSVAAGALFGLSFSVIDIGLETRAYALSIAFLLVALLAYVRWLVTNPRRLPWRVRLVFALSLSLALATHYASFFFLAATLGTPFVLAALHRRWRVRLAAELRTLPAALAMFGLPAASGAGAYLIHATHWGAGRLGHLPAFMFDGRESVPEFLARTGHHFAALFIPGPDGFVRAVAALLVVAAAWMVVRQRATVRVVPVPLVLIMVVLNVGAALAHRYPFGGVLRHQMFHFPFLVVLVLALIESLRRRLPARLGSRFAWTLGVAAAVTANFAHWRSEFVIGGTFMQAQVDDFRSRFPPRGAVLTDQFNFIVFFLHHADWKWHAAWQDKQLPVWQLWEVTRGDERLQVCRSNQWLLDETSPGTYQEVLECLERSGAQEVVIFRPEQPDIAPRGKGSAAVPIARQLADDLGLEVRGEHVTGTDFYMAFSAPPPATDGARVEVLEASYGVNCDAQARGNATSFVQRLCGDRKHCVFRVDVGAIGDPKPGCAKDFHVEWRCGPGEPPLQAQLEAEAGFGASARVSCRGP